MVFKPISTPRRGPESPEALFRDLRCRTAEGLLSQQADVLREYAQDALDKPDVGIELPTGSGKTLVGLLVAEWRRVVERERVVYLCPTRQLVHQVVEQATNHFGLHPIAFTGRKAEYAPDDKASYQNAEAVAVTTYSALFNTRPFFDDPQLIILDDAHTSENYIADPWCLRVARTEHASLFDSISDVIAPFLSDPERVRLAGEWRDSFERTWVDIVPTARLADVESDLIAMLDAGVEGTDLVFPWTFIRDHLRGCHLFIGTEQLTFRPWIPPTETHAPFAGARQRVYMSATLGQTGDLNRITGREKIHRLSTPATYEKHGVGRRLFLFPERSLPRDDAWNVALDAVQEAGRALCIVPSEESATELRHRIADSLGCATFDARDIEESKSAFLSEEHAVAVVANRYDGIDLPRNECRLLILDSLPRARSLMERFIIERMGASALLTERITNRIVQSVGRCTRADTDYAAVILLGEELGALLLQPDQRELFHPEMQAELEFGVQQANGATAEDHVTYVKTFLEQGPSWQQANEDILTLRAGATRRAIPGAQDLKSVVADEVRYQYALWSGDWEGALEAAREVLGELTDEGLRGYRALWLYLAGNAAWLLADAGVESARDTARDFFLRAHKVVPGVRWLRELARAAGASEEDAPADDGAQAQVVRMETVFETLGTQNNQRFSKEVLDIREGLAPGSGSQRFEDAHVRLGRLLGFDADNRETPGAPDPWWIVDSDLCLIFEDHSEADPSSSLNVNKARQVSSHVAWAREHLPLSDEARIVPVLVSPISRLDRDAVPHLSGVLHWPLDDFREWANTALGVVRQARTTFPGSGDWVWRTQTVAALRTAGLNGAGIVDMLQRSPADRLST